MLPVVKLMHNFSLISCYRNLSWNPFFCDCKLSWLPRWVEDRKVTVLQASDTRCAQPPAVANLSLFNVSFVNITCGKEARRAVVGEVIKPVETVGPRGAGDPS